MATSKQIAFSVTVDGVEYAVDVTRKGEYPITVTRSDGVAFAGEWEPSMGGYITSEQTPAWDSATQIALCAAIDEQLMTARREGR